MTEIFAHAKAALKRADSFRISGHAEVDGSLATMDLALTSNGGKAVIIKGQARMTMITIGKDSYIQGNDAFWKSAAGNPEDGPTLADQFRGKWLKTTTTAEQFGDLSNLAVKDTFVDDMVIRTKYSKTGPRIVHGYNCIGLRASGFVLWVDQATARLIAIRTSGGKADLVITDYNRVRAPHAPPANLVVDQPELG